jgi:hypothetical protein
MRHGIRFRPIKDTDASLPITSESGVIWLCDYAVIHPWWELGVKGTLKPYVSLNDRQETRWYNLEAYNLVIDGLSAGDIEINMERMAHSLIKFEFTPDLGSTGLLNVEMNAVSIGG